MAAVVAVTTVASVTYLHSREVEAKDTLDSINQLMNQVNKDQPYSILEIVPDDVSFTVSVNNSYGNSEIVSANQTMGFMGYYVGGSEPVRKDIEKIFGERKETTVELNSDGMFVNVDKWIPATVSDANIRAELIDRMLEKLSAGGILNNDVNGRSPLTANSVVRDGKTYYTAYYEKRESDDDSRPEGADYIVEDDWKLLNENTYRNFIDTVKGTMTLSLSGNYIKGYQSIVSGNTVINPAEVFLGAYLAEGKDADFADENFTYVSANKTKAEGEEDAEAGDENAGEQVKRTGNFEPNLTTAFNGEPTVAARFEHIPNAKFGYIVDPDSVKNKVVSGDEIAPGTPLYVKDGDVYVYYGTYAEVFGGGDDQNTDDNNNGDDDQNTDENNDSDDQNTGGDNDGNDQNTDGNNESGDQNIGDNSDAGDTNAGDNNGNEPENNLNGDARVIIKEERHLNKVAAAYPYIYGMVLLDNSNEDIILNENVEDDGILQDESSIVQYNDAVEDTVTDVESNNSVTDRSIEDKSDEEVVIKTEADPEGADDANAGETGGEGDVPEVEGDFYAVKFIYTKDETHKQYYGITGFNGADAEGGAQYIVDADSDLGVLVAADVNEDWFGCIQETAECAPEHFVYDYVGKEKGNYIFSAADRLQVPAEGTDVGVYRLRGVKLYYKLELRNDEWFKKYVFDRDDSELAAHPVEVKSVKVKDLKKADLDSRMVMLMSGDAQYCIGDKFTDYGTDYDNPDNNNFRPEVYAYMVKRAAEDKIPVVADYRIIETADKLDEDNGRTGNNKTKHYYDAYSMVEALMLEDMEMYNTSISGLDLSAEFNRYVTSELTTSLTKSANYNHFVNNNVYIYNMKTPVQKTGTRQNILNPYFFTMNDRGTDIRGFSDSEVKGDSAEAIEGGFTEVLQDIVNENLYRKTDKSSGVSRAPLPEDITLATVLRYIAGYSSKRVNNEKGIIRILEIEPVASFDFQVDDQGTSEVNTFWKGINNISSTTTYCNGTFVTDSGILKYKNTPLITQEGTRIELTRMSVAEFVGHIEDLNAEYDMIYIGMNIGENLSQGGLNTVEATDDDVTKHRAGSIKEKIPVYNDPDMRGLVYTAAGDYRYAWGSLLGSKAADYKNGNTNGKIVDSSSYSVYSPNWRTRYSGNDISEQDVAKIYNFIDAGYPVVFDDGFYLDPEAKKKVVNKAKVDSTSYMYALASNEWVLEQPNVFTRSNLTESLFSWYLNLAKPEIKMYGIAEQSMTDLQYIELSKIDNFYHASFEFELNNKGAASSSSTYNAALYIDVNADGKYSHSQEGIRLTSLVDAMGNEIYGTEDADGKNVTYELTTGERYTAQCQLARSYEGVVPWRLEITQNDNKLRRTNATGYYKIKKDNYTRINALQIMQSGNYSGWRGGSWNMDTTSKDPKNIFCKLLDKDVIGYDMNITAIKSNDFLNHTDAPHKTEEEYYNILTQYDMLILGFADCYEAPNSDAAISAIRDYIEDGYSVLFSHDCTSFHSYPETAKSGVSNGSDWGTYWGYYFNTKIRNIVGMDRYNILNNVVDDDIDHTYDTLYRANSGERSITFDNDGKLRTTIQASQDSYVPDQGYTYFNINKRVHTTISNTNVNKMNLKGMPKDIQTSQADNDTYEVTKVNDGQITKYPYVLPDRFTVANTHSQYFQLDFTADDDSDGESDIVVWYCLSDSNIKNHKDDGYEMSPNDVRNNYYIYNKGNITYTGVGHFHVIKDNGTPVGSEDEIKLFVNTLIACYQSGIHEPSLDVVESYENKDKKVSNIYLSYDQYLRDNGTDTNGTIERSVDVFFKTEKASLMQNSAKIEHRLSGALYYEISENEYNTNNTDTDQDPTKDTDGYVKLDDGAGNTLYGRKIDISAFNYMGSFGEQVGDITNLQDRVVYKATVPVSNDVLADIWDSSISASSKNNRRILVVTTDSSRNIKSERVKVKTKYSVAPVSLVRAQVFDLD
ncbi:MAG: DUF5057 domain-containing protein [Lachnospiraceae bacterium]|nr:DUF5057 domain-containing protein [Lachnospiraceae bacterium]